MKQYGLTPKSEALIETKVIDGDLYILCDKNERGELWLYMAPDNVEIDKCSNCGYSGPALDRHHIDGRKHSKKTILLCANCHRELHAVEGFK